MKTMYTSIAVVFATCFSISAVAQNKPDSLFQLYILIGQSNMAGRGHITDKFRIQSDNRVFMFNKERQWVTAKHPLHFDKPGITGVGPGLSFGIQMAASKKDIRIGLIPCAVGGTNIETWTPGGYDAATKTHPYNDAIARIREAMKYGVVKGVIWHQGEANSSSDLAKVYLLQLTELIGRIRSVVGNPNLPFVAGELGYYRTEFGNINRQLEMLPEKVSYTSVASAKRLVHKGDTIHFNSQSADKLGKRFAVEMLKLQKIKKR